MKSLKPNMLSWQKTVMKPTMLNLLKVLPVEIKSLSLKLNKEKLSENIQAYANMIKIKMLPKKENVHPLPLGNSLTKLKKNKRKSS